MDMAGYVFNTLVDQLLIALEPEFDQIMIAHIIRYPVPLISPGIQLR